MLLSFLITWGGWEGRGELGDEERKERRGIKRRENPKRVDEREKKRKRTK